MGFFKTLFTGHEETEEEKLQQKKQNQFDVFKYDGIQALNIHQTDYAIACFEHALEIQEDNETRQYYVKALLSNDNTDEAIAQLEILAKNQPEEPLNLLTLAELYLQQEKYDKVDEACDKCIQIDDTLAMPHYIKAKKYNITKDLINAVAQSTIAITKKPDMLEAYKLRAEILVAMQQYAEAEADIDYILTSMQTDNIEDIDYEILLLKADICHALTKDEEAKTYYNKVISFNPYATKAYLKLGEILMKEGKNKEAASIVEEGLKYAPEEVQGITGNFTNFEDKMREAYNAINPYQLGINL